MKKNAVLPFLMVTLMITSGCSKGAADAVTKGDFKAMSEVIEDTSEPEPLADKPQEASPDNVTLIEEDQAEDNGIDFTGAFFSEKSHLLHSVFP